MSSSSESQDSQELYNDCDIIIDASKGASLRKSVGLLSGTTMIVGTMIGSGIFISPKGVLEGTGSVGFSLVIWTACGVLSTLGALAYAELGTCIPRSGGEHAYFMYTFGSGSRRIGTIVAFLFDWMGLFLLRPIMFGVMCLSLGTYAVKPFFPTCVNPPDLPVKICTFTAMLLLAAVNIYSVKMATHLQIVTTFTKLFAIGIITIGGFYKICKGETDNIGEGFQDTREDPSLIAIAFYNGLWAYDGWNNLNFVTEELKEPEKTLPRAIMIGIPMTTIAYILANIGYFSVMSKEEVLMSHAVAVTWGDHMLGIMSWVMPIFVVLSCLGSANGSIFATGRLCYASARDGHFPRILSFIQCERFTPMPSIIFTVAVSIITIIPSDISTLIDFYSFCIMLGYATSMVALLVLRYTQPNLKRPYKVPLIVPVLVLIASVYLIVSPIIQTRRITFLYAVLFIFSGVFVYFPFIYCRIKVPGIDALYRFLQKLFLIVPPYQGHAT